MALSPLERSEISW